jgi:hypothetical protein
VRTSLPAWNRWTAKVWQRMCGDRLGNAASPLGLLAGLVEGILADGSAVGCPPCLCRFKSPQLWQSTLPRRRTPRGNEMTSPPLASLKRRRPTASPGRGWGQRRGRLWAEVSDAHPQAVRGAAAVDHDSVVGEPPGGRTRDDLIAEHGSPPAEGLLRVQHEAAPVSPGRARAPW